MGPERRAVQRQHWMRVHGQQTVIQSIANDQQCPMCGLWYITRRRAVDHISYRSKVCRAAALQAIDSGSVCIISAQEERAARDSDLQANRRDKLCGRPFCLAGVPGPKCGRNRTTM